MMMTFSQWIAAENSAGRPRVALSQGTQKAWQEFQKKQENQNVLLESIAKEYFDIDTLEVRNSDRLDFYDVSVGSIKAALKKAYEEGVKSQQ